MPERITIEISHEVSETDFFSASDSELHTFRLAPGGKCLFAFLALGWKPDMRVTTNRVPAPPPAPENETITKGRPYPPKHECTRCYFCGRVRLASEIPMWQWTNEDDCLCCNPRYICVDCLERQARELRGKQDTMKPKE